MGAKNCAETPRQKLIAMMYLVLTALLALNVSREILNSFCIVEDGLKKTNETFKKRSEIIYTGFEQQYSQNKTKVEPYYEAAQKAKKLSEEMCKYIHELRIRLIMETAKLPREIADTIPLIQIEAKDNYDIPTNILIPTEDPSVGEARVLKNHLIKYREDLKDLIRKDERLKFVQPREKVLELLGDLGIHTEDPAKDPDHPELTYWETSHFYHIPLAAVLTMIAKIENEVLDAEALMVNMLFKAIGAADFKFDTLSVKVVPKSMYVNQGDKYEAELFIAALSTTENPIIYVGEGYNPETKKLTGRIDSVPVTQGVGKYTVSTSSLGDKKYSAIIKVKDPVTGAYKEHPLKIGDNYYAQYTVMKPAVVVSPTKMNVFYIGVDNPVDISVSGVPSEKVSASMENGTLKKNPKGGYIVRPNNPGKAYISVSMKDNEGKTRSMGKIEFRVKRVPTPRAQVGGKSEGKIEKHILLAQGGVIANMEDFDFDCPVKVTQFTVSTTTPDGFFKSQGSKSNKFTEAQIQLMKGAKKGQKIYIEDIKAQSCDGRTRDLLAIVLVLQ